MMRGSAAETLRRSELWTAVILFEIAIGFTALMLPFQFALSLALVIPLLFVLFAKPILGLCIIIPLLPNYPYVLFSIGEIRIHPIDPVLLITVVCWLLICLRRREFRIQGTPLDIALFFLLAWCLFSLLWTPSLPRGVVQALKMVKGLAIYHLHVQMVRDKRDFDFLLSAWIVTGVIFSLIGFRELLIYGLEAAAKLGQEYERLTREVRTTALFDQPNSLGFFLVLCILIGGVKYLVTPSRPWKHFLWAAIPFMFLVLLSTFSRKSFLGLFLAVAYLSLQRKKIFVASLGIALVTVLTIVILGYGGFADVLVERFATFFQAPEAAITERVKVWTTAYKVFLSSPVMGNGLGSSVFYLRLEDLSLQTTHNMYLYILAELGLIGFLLFLLAGAQMFGALHVLSKTTERQSVNLMCKGLVAGFIVILAQGGFKALNLVDPILWGQLGLAGAFLRVYGTSSKGLPSPQRP